MREKLRERARQTKIAGKQTSKKSYKKKKNIHEIQNLLIFYFVIEQYIFINFTCLVD